MHKVQKHLIIVVVQVGAVKIYVASMGALRKMERQDETQFITKFAGKTSLGPSYAFDALYYAETDRSCI
jgi:hypothetical protein